MFRIDAASKTYRTRRGGDVTALSDVTLDITGMTCASCASRIERRLNKLDGVSANVSYGTERALVTYPTSLPTARSI